MTPDGRAYLQALLDVDEGEHAPDGLDLDALRASLAPAPDGTIGRATALTYIGALRRYADAESEGNPLPDDAVSMLADLEQWATACPYLGTPHTQAACLDGGCGEPADARTYVIGLPVVMTVYGDGSVSAEVDLSEADDLFDSSVATPDGQDTSEDTMIRDREAISAAFTAQSIIVR